MSMNIKKAGTHERARQLAKLAGESLTDAVDRAITERLERIRKTRNKERSIQKMLAIGRELSKLPVLDPRHPDDILYDANGLPK
jgi:antitoxin VapB